MQCKIFQDGVFTRSECHFPARERHEAVRCINHQLSDSHCGHGFSRTPANEGADAGEEFILLKGLHEIIIGTGVKAAHAVLGGITCGEHHHGRAFLFAQLREHRPAIETWEHQVEHNGVVINVDGLEQSVVAVLSGVHRIACTTQCPGEAGEQVGVVFDEEQSHGAP